MSAVEIVPLPARLVIIDPSIRVTVSYLTTFIYSFIFTLKLQKQIISL